MFSDIVHRIAAYVAALAAVAIDAQAASLESFTEPFRVIDVAPAEPGTLTEVHVQEGDHVRKGQILGSLDRDVLAVALEIARATMQAHGRIDASTAEVELRRIRLARLEELRQRAHANQDEVDRARTDLMLAEANVRIAQEQADVDALEFKKTQALIERRLLRSSIDGVVTRVHKDVQEYVPATNPSVVTVVQLDPLRVVFSLPTHIAASLRIGETAELSFPETATDGSGRIEFVSSVTEPDSGTVRVKV